MPGGEIGLKHDVIQKTVRLQVGSKECKSFWSCNFLPLSAYNDDLAIIQLLFIVERRGTGDRDRKKILQSALKQSTPRLGDMGADWYWVSEQLK